MIAKIKTDPDKHHIVKIINTEKNLVVNDLYTDTLISCAAINEVSVTLSAELNPTTVEPISRATCIGLPVSLAEKNKKMID